MYFIIQSQIFGLSNLINTISSYKFQTLAQLHHTIFKRWHNFITQFSNAGTTSSYNFLTFGLSTFIKTKEIKTLRRRFHLIILTILLQFHHTIAKRMFGLSSLFISISSNNFRTLFYNTIFKRWHNFIISTISNIHHSSNTYF